MLYLSLYHIWFSLLQNLLQFKWHQINSLSLSERELTLSPVCSSWRPPHPYQTAGCPCSAWDRADSGNLDRCWRSVAFHSLCSKHQTPYHTEGGKGKRGFSKMQTNSYTSELSNQSVVYAHEKNRNLYLVNVFTVGTISTETSRAWAALPGSIWSAVTVHSSKARVGQTAICKRFRQQEWIQTKQIDLNIIWQICIVYL